MQFSPLDLFDRVLQSVNGYAGFVLNIDLKGPALHVLLAQLDPANFAKYDKYARMFFDQYLNQAGIQHTQRGLAYPYHYGRCPMKVIHSRVPTI